MRYTRSTVTAAAALAVAAVTAVSASVALATSGGGEPAAEFGALAPGLTTPQPDEAKGTAGLRGPSGATAPTSGGSSSQKPDVAKQQDTAPTRLSINSLAVSAPVVPTGVTRAGNAQIPRDGDVVGWYEFGSAPGDATGSTVLIGHRDTQAEGPGVLFDLDTITPGDVLTVRSGSTSLRYEVVALRSIDKDGLPDSLFRRGGPPQLVVITCGGAFIPEAGGYQENLFAVAVPVDR